jgi:hypothetical protein
VAKKRREAQLVQLKIRIRERLRQRLERSAKEQEIPLAHEIVRRLENSFEQEATAHLLSQLLASGAGMDLLKAIAAVLSLAGPDWQKDPLRREVAGAINKVVAFAIGEQPRIASPYDRPFRGDADGLASIAMNIYTRDYPRPRGYPRPGNRPGSAEGRGAS